MKINAIALLVSLLVSLLGVNVPETEATGKQPQSQPEYYDFGGREFVFLCGESENGSEIFREEYNGEIVNDAIYSRNIHVSDEFNTFITEVTVPDVQKMAWNAILAADNFYDALNAPITVCAYIAQRGGLYDLCDLEHIDLSQPWWYGGINDTLAVGGRRFIASGAMNISALDSASAVLYNRHVLGRFKLEDNYYQKVLDGQWTFEAFLNLMLDTMYDYNGDAVMSLGSGDIVGIAAKSPIDAVLNFAAGVRTVELDGESGMLKVSKADEAALSAVSPLSALIKYCPVITDENAFDYFVRGEAAAYVTALSDVYALRGTEANFGILPLPKASASQESYETYVNAVTAKAVGVPVMQNDLEFAGIILEAMNKESFERVLPSCYDRALTGKFTRDTESAMMLDIITSGMTVDLGQVLGLGGRDAEYIAAAVDKLNTAYENLR